MVVADGALRDGAAVYYMYAAMCRDDVHDRH